MFCPNCGRSNARELRFCASCGTNLEAVSQALSGVRDDFFTKTDTALDQLIARYSEHVFRNSPSRVNDRRVSNSWKILGEGVVTSFVDIILFSLMWNILPLRFLILLISTPFRLLSQRGRQQRQELEKVPEKAQLLESDTSDNWLAGSFPSVSEHTTQNLQEVQRPQRKKSAEQ